MLRDQTFNAAPCGMAWHFTDTRTALGRVRVVLHGQQLDARVTILAEGEGWSVQQTFEGLQEAVLGLAWLSEVPQALYLQALSDLQTQQQFYNQYAA